MLKVADKKSNGGIHSRGDAIATADDSLTLPLASAIRSISALMANNADCDEIALAVSQCAASMLPGCSALVLDVRNEPPVAQVIASVNARYVAKLEVLPIDTSSLLQQALNEPLRCHIRDNAEASRLFSQYKDFSADTDVIIACKSVLRSGFQPIVLMLLTDMRLESQAENTLMTLSELLQVFCAAHDGTNSDRRNQFAIRNAKNEWEATVDTLGELVCLIDSDGKILRANRTAERWRLSSVVNVRGMNIHEMLHPSCRLDNCALEGATDLRRLIAGSVDSFESVIVDKRLERALKIHIQRVEQLPDAVDSSHNAMAVVVISDITALHNARTELKTLNESLEQKVHERTDALMLAIQKLKLENRQRRNAESDLKVSRDDLAQLSEQLMSAQEDERSRLSRELHDSVGQSLGAIKYTLERLATARAQSNGDEPNEILARAISGVAEAIRDTRSIAMGLRPPILDIGATAAVQWLVKNFSKIYPDIDFRIDTAVTNEEITGQLSTQVYRIAQESLSNAVKHADAKTVLTSIHQELNKLTLEIVDDGVGFNTNDSDSGQFRRQARFGHLGMRERAANSNGVLSIRSTPGVGTRIKVEWNLTTGNTVQE